MDEDAKNADITNAICELNRLSHFVQNPDYHEARSDSISQSARLPAYNQPHQSNQHNHYNSQINPYAINNTSAATTKLQMNLNPRYISKISNSPRKTQDTSLRMRPYFVPERSRTKSENTDYNEFFHFTGSDMSSMADGMANGFMVAGRSVTSGFGGAIGTSTTATNSIMMDTDHSLNDLGHVGCSGLTLGSVAASKKYRICASGLKKKSKSLEDVRAENLDGSLPSHEMEFVSSRIQKLKVQD